MQSKLETMRLQLGEVADDDADGVGRIMESAIMSGIDGVLMEYDDKTLKTLISRRRKFVSEFDESKFERLTNAGEKRKITSNGELVSY